MGFKNGREYPLNEDNCPFCSEEMVFKVVFEASGSHFGFCKKCNCYPGFCISCDRHYKIRDSHNIQPDDGICPNCGANNFNNNGWLNPLKADFKKR